MLLGFLIFLARGTGTNVPTGTTAEVAICQRAQIAFCDTKGSGSPSGADPRSFHCVIFDVHRVVNPPASAKQSITRMKALCLGRVQ